MPYIKPSQREQSSLRPQGAGELTYHISKFVGQYLADNGLDFAHFSECIAALECAKLELYRRVGAPYEDTKLRDYGDIFPASILTKFVDASR